MTRKKKRRRLKKWVFVTIHILVVIIIVVILFAIHNYNINNEKIINNKKHDDKVNILDNGSDLNRVVYKKGFYYEDLPEEIIDKITGVTYPKEFDENYSSINYDDLKYIIVKYYDFKGKEHNNGKVIGEGSVWNDGKMIFQGFINNNSYKKHFQMKEIDEDDIFKKFILTMKNNAASFSNFKLFLNFCSL